MDYVRSIVSGKKIRYLEDGFNLDLSYITPRIIAMSLPGEGVHKVYRNSISSVSKFLNLKHKDRYKIINLSGLRYDYSKFNDQVDEYDWVDHYPPDIEVLFKACKMIECYLSKDPENVIIINCKAGKGRTGTLICCFLLYTGRFSDWKLATSYYRAKRFFRGGGVTQPSQLRYIQYFTQILQGWVKYPLVTTLNRIHVRTVPHYSKNSSKLVLKINVAGSEIFNNKSQNRDEQISLSDSWEDLTIHELAQFTQQIPIYGEVFISLHHWSLVSMKKVCRVHFNTAFIPINSQLKFEKSELDPDSFKTSKKVSDKFYIQCFFHKICSCTVDKEFEERCEKCKEVLGHKEREKWNQIWEVVAGRKIEDPKFLLFGFADDDVDEVISRVVDEAGFSSDGSNN